MIAPADDLDRIMQVMEAAFDPAFGEAWTRRQVEDALLTGNCHYGLVFRQDRCAGFFLSRSILDEEELLLLAVCPEFRRQGFGQQLISQLFAEARERGCEYLLLEMRRGNPAESLYVRNYFKPIGLRQNYYKVPSGDRIDAITFKAELSNFFG